ncbi:hypothetical protein L1049_016229 [Liquidambar formosana]|uniref:Uncharacterized protein n=1 Tax=Liquidambar formosana TaxID=63359 RepID=A0AAP0S0B3_LIQFO
MKAWVAACHWKGKARLVVPKGDFLLGQVIFGGPCNGPTPIVVQITGTLKAVTDLSEYASAEWVTFESINGLNIKFNRVTNGVIKRISSVNPKSFHMVIYGCTDLRAHRLHIFAPEDSPNTDGIHVSESNQVKISKSVIGTGDDCISIGQGSTNIGVNRASKVKISNVHYKNIRGTSTTPVAVNFMCSKQFPCQNVELFNINLKYVGNKQQGLPAGSASTTLRCHICASPHAAPAPVADSPAPAVDSPSPAVDSRALVPFPLTGHGTEPAPSEEVFDVTNYGAVGDGMTENSLAFLAAWDDACDYDGDSTLFIPSGTFLVGPISFSGPCNNQSPNIEISGTLLAPLSLKAFPTSTWIKFQRLQGFRLTGGTGTATLDAQGEEAWKHKSCHKKKKCNNLPRPSLVKLSNISFKNIRGTSNTKPAATFRCSSIAPCENIQVVGVNLSYIMVDRPRTALSVVKGALHGVEIFGFRFMNLIAVCIALIFVCKAEATTPLCHICASPHAAPAPAIRQSRSMTKQAMDNRSADPPAPVPVPSADHGISPAPPEGVFDVTKYGAVADGKTDSSSALSAAWEAACDYDGDSTLFIPNGTFFVGPITFSGPCNNDQSPKVEIRGTLKAPSSLKAFPTPTWIMFRSLNGLRLTGGTGTATLDAQGPSLVKLSNISFKNIRGTSNTKPAVTIRCSSTTPCENMELVNVNLNYTAEVDEVNPRTAMSVVKKFVVKVADEWLIS